MKLLVSCPRGRTFDTFFTYENIRLAEKLGTVVWNPYARNMSVSEAAEMIEGCDVYVTTWGAPRLESEMLDAAPNLRLLTHLCTDPSHLMSSAAWGKGVKVISGHNYYSAALAEGTVAYILATLRNIPELSYRLKYKREWKYSWDTNSSIAGKTVGIVNFNGIAEHTIRMLSVFGVRFVAYDALPLPANIAKRYEIQQISLNKVLEYSDIICVQEPSTFDGHNMISFDQLSRIRSGALLVSTSSGNVINPLALYSALASGRFYAILDVYEKEPLLRSDPLFLFPNVMLMPHMAGPTLDTRALVTKKLLLESDEFIRCGGRLTDRVRRGERT